MIKKYFLYSLPLLLLSLASCEKSFDNDNFEAYFGGEIINPQNNFVLFLKNDEIIDTIFLDKNNRFLHKFDSLTPGLYTFKHLPEYQYIYFEKNDSIMVRLNSLDFDNSIAFCGRGDEKNNFLIDLYLKNELDRATLYDVLDRDSNGFIKNIDSVYKIRKAHYLKKKTEIGWSLGFDAVAQAGLDFHHYYKKELYPYAHKYKTGNDVSNLLPKDFYDYRKKIEYNNEEFTNFSPFIKFVNIMLSNVSYDKSNGLYNEMSLENNILKLNIADTLIKNQKTKNSILNNIAYMYLLEDQNMYNNKTFIDKYLQLSSDKEQQIEVTEIYNSVKNLNIGNKLPVVELTDVDLNPISIETITANKETVIFFWTSHADSHLKSVHKRVREFKKKYPEVNFIAINVDDTNENWTKALKNNNLNDGILELKSSNFQEIKKLWVITKIHRTIILDKNGNIKKGFANLFDVNFENDLK